MRVNSQNHVYILDARNKYLPLHQWLHSSEIPGWTGYLEVCYQRKTTQTMTFLLRNSKTVICRHADPMLRLSKSVPFGKKKVFKGTGQLWPHGVELPR